MASLQDLYKLISSYQAQKRKSDNAPPWERNPIGRAKTPFAITPMPGPNQSSVQSVGTMSPLTPLMEGQVVPGGVIDPEASREMAQQGEFFDAGAPTGRYPEASWEELKTPGALRVPTRKRTPTLPGQSAEEYQPSMPEARASIPQIQQAAAPALDTGGGIGALSPDKGVFDPRDLGSGLGNIPVPKAQSPVTALAKPEEGMFSRALKNPLFLTGAGMLANSRKNPFEAAGIATLNASGIHGKNKQADIERALQERRLTNEERRTDVQDQYQRERNRITDERWEKEYKDRGVRQEREDKKLDAVIAQNSSRNRLMAFNYARERIENERKALSNSLEAQTNPKILADFEKQAERRMKAYMVEALPPTLSYQSLEKGPQGIAALD